MTDHNALIGIPRFIELEINKHTAPLLARIAELEKRVTELESAPQPERHKPGLLRFLTGGGA